MYKSDSGIYVSNIILDGDFQAEIDKLPFYLMQVDKAYAQVDDERGLGRTYDLCAFRSIDGKSSTLTHPPGEEKPEDFEFTEAYYNSPTLARVIDFFQVPMMRARIFRQLPGGKNNLHTDFDSQRPGGEDTLRITVMLSDMPDGAWFKYVTGDSVVNVNLRKGQFVVFNADTVQHQTNNLTDEPRDTFMLVIKKNDWLQQLTEWEDPAFVDCSVSAEEEAA